MTTKKSTADSTDTKAKRTSRCWPGYEPVPGKAPRTKDSCRPKPGKKSAAVERADQKAAAASRLEKQGKPNLKRRSA